METIRIQARGEITVTSDGLLQIVRAHFDRISPVQWAMLSNGTCDIETTNVILSLFVQLIQTLSTNVLRVVIPRDEVRLKCLDDEESNRAFQTITTVLQQSIGLIFGKALNVPCTQDVDLSNESQELTVLIETEVSKNVNSILSTGTQHTQGLEFRVAFKLHSVETRRNILDRAKRCLQMCLNSLKCSCAESRSVTNSPVSQTCEPEACARSEGSSYERKRGPCHCCFSLFARKNYKKMQENIDNKILTEVASVGSASRTGSSTSSGGMVSPVLSSPGAPALGTPEQDFEEIQRDVEEIFHAMNMTPHHGSSASQQRLNEYLQSDEVSRLGDKLANIMYSHFNLFDWYKELTTDSGRCYSESALLINPGQATSTNFQALNSFVAYEVSKFIKKLCNFMQQDPLDYLNNVDLFELCMDKPTVSVSPQDSNNPPRSVHSQVSESSINSQRYNIFERSAVHPKACVPSYISADVPAIVLHTPKEEETESASHTDISKTALEVQPSPEYLMTRAVVLELTHKVFKKVPIPERQNYLYQTFEDRLTQKAQVEIELEYWQIKNVQKNRHKIAKGVMKSLKKKYGSSERVAAALFTDSDAFEATALEYLQAHIDLKCRTPSLKSRILQSVLCCCDLPWEGGAYPSLNNLPSP